MNKDYIDALWHEAELASVNSDLEIHQIFYKLIEKDIRADEREACIKVIANYSHIWWDWAQFSCKTAAAIRARGEVK